MGGKRHVDFESILADVYGTGFYQITLLIACSMTCFIGGLEIQTILFMHYTPAFTCQEVPTSLSLSVNWVPRETYENLVHRPNDTAWLGHKSNSTVQQCWAVLTNSSSNEVTPFSCSNWTYDQTVTFNTVVTQFNLICDQHFWIPLMEASYLVFNSVGFVVAFVSDKIGRRIPLLAFAVWGIVICLATPFVQSLSILLFLRCCRGMSTALMYIGINLLSELVPLSYRAAYGNVYWTSWPVGYMVCAGIAYLVRDWFSLRLWSCIFLLTYLCFPFIVVDSPRWLYVRGRKKEAINILQKLARWNRASLPADYFDRIEDRLPSEFMNCGGNSLVSYDAISSNGISIDRLKDNVQDNDEKEDSFMDIFRYPNLRNNTLIFCVVHIAIAVVYYGLIMDSLFTIDDIFMNMLLSGLVELPSSFLSWAACAYLGRRSSTSALLLISGIGVLVSRMVTPNVTVLRTITALIVKFALGIAYCVADLFITELYPTTLRNIGFFTVVTVAGLASAVAPYINYLSHINTYLPYLIYAGLSIASAIMVHFGLPETRSCPLPQTVKESQGFVRGKERDWCEKRKRIYVDPAVGNTIMPIPVNE
ncbi:MFS transporter OCT family solute carrier family 22 (organic cation transporter) member 5 [Clonorchis sinensis]|uniref:MFS transporter OCT family solute carrier family 22 (Organic cation transporter) member 5 n=1 Tax=Clonorchis sinensis TaxID=79923 RepID=H2KTQ9_CLOSI|nr:MFS transporter OCT family solute carrier family 22 (organic cation transporter) member 5 [Clonorchis sinensis]